MAIRENWEYNEICLSISIRFFWGISEVDVLLNYVIRAHHLINTLTLNVMERFILSTFISLVKFAKASLEVKLSIINKFRSSRVCLDRSSMNPIGRVQLF